ncbi:MAG TPA: hypothetical protein VMN39_00510 [Longimicrobiaceae bacterium]|nr:hypothetical protein [Longimicrobiaceae bacterium]
MGTLPECYRTDGYINVGKGHWFYCKAHRTKWFIGANLFSSWTHETEAEQRARYDEMGFGFFREVAEVRFPAAPLPGLDLPGRVAGD